MIAVDTNVLVAAHRREAEDHAPALKRLKELTEGEAAWGIPIFCLAEFIRVATHPQVFRPPSTLADASAMLNVYLDSPTCRLLLPGLQFRTLFARALEEGEARGNAVFDAQIVAVCREAGVSVFLTRDRDFARFKNFRTQAL